MQYENHQLKRQQLIMNCLGFYNGKFDGIWGPKSIDAKKRFESSSKFLPAIPTNGMPFAGRGPFPNGISAGRDGLLYHDSIEGVLEKERVASKTPVPAETKKSTPTETPKAEVVPTETK